MARPPVGELMKQWRVRRRRSQLDLSLDVGVSTRHLSFVETGRSRPSPELVLAVAHHLDVPLRDRNAMLLAAGYAPRFSQASLDEPSMARIRMSVQRMLDIHDPYPGVVIDRQWNIVLANRAASALTANLPDHVTGPRPNVYRLCLHPDGLAAQTLNFADWGGYLLGQLRRSAATTGDPQLDVLLAEVSGYPNVRALGAGLGQEAGDEPPILVPVQLTTADGELSMFTTLTTFGTPLDITVEELAVELFFPADEASETILRAAAG